MMKIRKVKRKCNVLGCKCSDSYALTATTEYGSSVVICKDCLEKALDCVNKGLIEGLPKTKPTEAVAEAKDESTEAKTKASAPKSKKVK